MTEQEYRDAVYAEAKETKSPDALKAFVEKLAAHPHDYGTIVYACCAAAMAAWRTVNASPQGGITGFQAGCAMWEMVKDLGSFSDGPLRIQDFDHLRYPQYDDQWAVVLSAEGAKSLMERAAKDDFLMASPAVRQRNAEIARGEFPPFVTVKPEDDDLPAAATPPLTEERP